MCTTTEQKPQAPGHQSDLFDSGDEKSRVRFSQQSMGPWNLCRRR